MTSVVSVNQIQFHFNQKPAHATPLETVCATVSPFNPNAPPHLTGA